MIRWTWSLWSKTKNFEMMWSGTGTSQAITVYPIMPVLGHVLLHKNLNFHVATHIFHKGIHHWSEDLVHSLYYLIPEVDLYLDLLNSLSFWLRWGYWMIQITLYCGSVFIYYSLGKLYLKILLAAFFMLVFRTMIKALKDMAHYTNPCRIPVEVPYLKLISCWHSYSWDLLANNFLTRIRYVLLRLCSVHGWRRITAQSIDLARMDVSHICWQIIL